MDIIMWPFKEKDNPDKSMGAALPEYNQLRASVGMPPAKDDDPYEGVAWVVVSDLLAPEGADECRRFPIEEREMFMMTYATCLSWLAMISVKSQFPPESWQWISPLLKREFSKHPWYKEEVMSRLFDSMVGYSLGRINGKYLGASLGPWSDAIKAANLAGHKLSRSTDPWFNIYVNILSRKLLETIAQMAPTG